MQSPSRPRTIDEPLAVATILCVCSAAGGCAAVNANMSKEHIQAWAERTVPVGTPVAEAQRRLSRNRIKNHLDTERNEVIAVLDEPWWYPAVSWFTWMSLFGRIHFPYDENQLISGASVELGGAGP